MTILNTKTAVRNFVAKLNPFAGVRRHVGREIAFTLEYVDKNAEEFKADLEAYRTMIRGHVNLVDTFYAKLDQVDKKVDALEQITSRQHTTIQRQFDAVATEDDIDAAVSELEDKVTELETKLEGRIEELEGAEAVEDSVSDRCDDFETEICDLNERLKSVSRLLVKAGECAASLA